MSLVDTTNGAEILAPGATGNAFIHYADQGGLYRFGNEMDGCTLEPRAGPADEGLDAEILETGPLRVRLRTQSIVAGEAYEREYALVAGEPFLRMRVTGAAPPGDSVMVHFPLAGSVDAIVHGTPYHWDRKTPERARWGVSVEATHDFVVPIDRHFQRPGTCPTRDAAGRPRPHRAGDAARRRAGRHAPPPRRPGALHHRESASDNDRGNRIPLTAVPSST